MAHFRKDDGKRLKNSLSWQEYLDDLSQGTKAHVHAHRLHETKTLDTSPINIGLPQQKRKRFWQRSAKKQDAQILNSQTNPSKREDVFADENIAPDEQTAVDINYEHEQQFISEELPLVHVNSKQESSQEAADDNLAHPDETVQDDHMVVAEQEIVEESSSEDVPEASNDVVHEESSSEDVSEFDDGHVAAREPEVSEESSDTVTSKDDSLISSALVASQIKNKKTSSRKPKRSEKQKTSKNKKSKEKKRKKSKRVVSPPPPPVLPKKRTTGGDPDPHKRWKGIVALLLMAVPLWAIPFFLEDVWRYILLGVVFSITVSVLSYWLGRNRSTYLAPFYARERLHHTGETIFANKPVLGGLGIIAAASLAILLPGYIGLPDAGQSKDTKPPKVITTEINREVFTLGQYHTLEGVEYFGGQNVNPKAIQTLNRSVQPAPKGYKWVLFQVRIEALQKESEFYASNLSIRLVDDHNQVYLPNYGSGANNAEDGYARVGKQPFWNPAYLIPKSHKPLYLEIAPFQASDTIFIFRYPTEKEHLAVINRLKRKMGLNQAQGQGSGKRDLVELTEKEQHTLPKIPFPDTESDDDKVSAE